ISVKMTRMCIPTSYARYSAAVRAIRGVMSRSTAGSSARFRNRTARRSAPVRSKSSMNTRASSWVMPIAAKTTPKGSGLPGTFACRAICSATSLCGRPAPENSGSFWPRTSVLRPSIVEMPVWMNSAGCSREYGLIAAPVMSTRFSGTIGGPPSIGSPAPLRIRPSMSRDTFSLIVSPRNFTVEFRSIPAVPSNTWTTTMSFDESRTCPRFRDPSGRPTSTSSPYPTHSVFSTKISGPAISVIVRYSVGISGGPQSLELVVHLGERLRELLVEFRFVLHPRQEFAGLQRRHVLRRDVQFHGLLTEVGVFLDLGDQLELPLGRAERVDGMIRVLLEEDLTDHPRDLERELLVRRQGIRADEPDDFLELRLFLQRARGPRSQLRPFLVHVLPEPVLQDLRVQAVRLEPVDGREVPPSPQGGVQSPEHLHDAERALGDGLREVPAARGDCADDADGPLKAAQRLRPTCALVELAEPRGQVRREAFLARHLFEPTRNLSHRFGPSRGRVRHQCDVVSHVSVVFRERHAGVHRRLPRSDRHVARVRDEGHAFHQGRAGVRILELREGGQDFGHLVPPLAASDVDDDLRIAPLRELLFGHRVVEEARQIAADEIMCLRDREIEHPRAVRNRFRLDDYILTDGTVLERHGKTTPASQLRGVDFHDSRPPGEQSVDGCDSKRSSGLRSDSDEAIRKATVENRRETLLDLGSVKTQDRDRIVEANPRFPLTPHMLTSRAVVKLVDSHGVAAGIHHQGVRRDTLAGPKAARDRGGPALRDREEEVEDPLARDERDGGHEPILHGPGPANGPGLVHLHLFPVVELRHHLVDLERALANLCDLPAAEVRGDHDSVLDVLRLLDRAYTVARAHRLAWLHLRRKCPRLLPRETRGLHPPEDEVSHHLLEDRERPLDAVVDAPEEARAQLDDEGPSRVEDGFAGPDATRVLVHLDDRFLAHDLDDFPEQLLLTDELDVVHARAETRGRHDRSCNSEDLPRRLAGRRFLLSFHCHVGFRPLRYSITCTGRPRS